MSKTIWFGVLGFLCWLAMGFWLFGCVSIPTHERGLIGARIDALQKARKIAYYNHSEETVKQINALIKKEQAKEQ